MNIMKKIMVGILSTVLLAGILGCANSHATRKGAAGAGIGAVSGAVIGHQYKGRAVEGAAIGGALGGATGYIIGDEQDKREAAEHREAILQESNTVTVNITNSNGSITPVRLVRSGNIWIGPRGEQYMSIPTEAQLKPVYGF